MSDGDVHFEDRQEETRTALTNFQNKDLEDGVRQELASDRVQ